MQSHIVIAAYKSFCEVNVLVAYHNVVINSAEMIFVVDMIPSHSTAHVISPGSKRIDSVKEYIIKVSLFICSSLRLLSVADITIINDSASLNIKIPTQNQPGASNHEYFYLRIGMEAEEYFSIYLMGSESEIDSISGHKLCKNSKEEKKFSKNDKEEY